MQQTKRCRICGKRKLLDDFYLSRGRPRAECKKCTLERLKAWQHAHPDQRRIQNQRYYARHYCPHPRPKAGMGPVGDSCAPAPPPVQDAPPPEENAPRPAEPAA